MSKKQQQFTFLLKFIKLE